ncbi:MAG: transposase [Acidobacteria bacterium]|nr:transposase [Acidobacteriota bacterium]
MAFQARRIVLASLGDERLERSRKAFPDFAALTLSQKDQVTLYHFGDDGSIDALPPDDTRYSMRWSAIKGRFTDLFLADGGTETQRSASRRKRGERGVWQRRFWDHVIRDDDDYGRHMDYIHYNPVKHGLVRCPHAWPHSSFAKCVRQGAYAADWMCLCTGRPVKPPDFGDVEGRAGE